MDPVDECRVLRQVLNLLSEQVIVRDASNNVVFQNAASQAAERDGGGAFITVVDTDIVGPTPTVRSDIGVEVAGVAMGFGGATVASPSEGASAPAAPHSPLRLIVRSPAGAESPVVRAVMNALPHCAYLVKPTGHAEFINTRFQSTLSMSLEEAEAADWCVHPDDSQRVRDSWFAAFSTGNLPAVEFRQQAAGGSFRWCSVSASPIRDGDGRIVRWLGERVDIHDGKELQSRLEEERALLTAVLENLPVGVSVADPFGRLTMINKRTFEIWRGRQSESRSVAEYGEWRAFHPDGRRYEGADWPIARSLSARETVTDHECVFERSDGTRGILNLCTAPVLNGRGELIAAVATCADVTDLRRMHEAETRRLAAEQLAAATRNLLSNCSHELRTVRG